MLPPHPHVTERKFTKRWEVFLLHIPWEMLVNNCMYFICRAKSCLMFLMRPSSQRTLILTVVEVWGRLFSIRKGNHLGEVSLMFWFTNFVKKRQAYYYLTRDWVAAYSFHLYQKPVDYSKGSCHQKSFKVLGPVLK